MATTKKTTTTTTSTTTTPVTTPAAPAKAPVASATNAPAPAATAAPAPYSAAVATNALIEQAMKLIEDGMKKSLGLIKTGNYAEALSISKELDKIAKTISEEISSKQDDINALIQFSEAAPAKLNDKGSIKSQLKELNPGAIVEVKPTKRQKAVNWLTGRKEGDLK